MHSLSETTPGVVVWSGTVQDEVLTPCKIKSWQAGLRLETSLRVALSGQELGTRMGKV